MAVTDTIAAIATGAARGGIGVIRISGPQAFTLAAQLCGPMPPPRFASLRKFKAADGVVIDQGIVLCFAQPASFTGEDVVELQGHGGPRVLADLLECLVGYGARLARPGEFSERAFLNGQIDLAQAEAIADLIDAASSQAVRAAQRTLAGEFSEYVHQLTQQLTDLRVFVEGALDFSDEDIPWLADAGLAHRLEALEQVLAATQAKAKQGARLREGLVVAIAGQPNVGKSTLLNALAGFDAAIVSEHAGTTRDVLREHLTLRDLPITVVDTAGLRETADPVEAEGIRRAWAALHKAELILFVVSDADGITEEDRQLMARLPDLPRILIRNKCDVTGAASALVKTGEDSSIQISAKKNIGLDLLIDALHAFAGLHDRGEGVFLARSRHLAALASAYQHLKAARAQLAANSHAELAAEELRLAQLALGEITGIVTSDALLGHIFSRFCIGK